METRIIEVVVNGKLVRAEAITLDQNDPLIPELLAKGFWKGIEVSSVGRYRHFSFLRIIS